MPALKLENLSGGAHLKAYSVPAPEAGDGMEVWIAELNAYERDARIESAWLKYQEETGAEGQEGFRAFAVAACWCDGPGREFVAKLPADVADVAARLQLQQCRWVTRAFVKVNELNAISGDSLEDAEKN